jgi:type IV secretory pathway VirB4 component
MVIDPRGEYRILVKYFGGQRIDLSRDSDTMINPMDLMGYDYAEKRLALMDLMQIMLGKLSDPQKAFIDKAISEAYKKKGVLDDPSTWANNQVMKNSLSCIKNYKIVT